ncbi:MAG TPA: hypothetical protein VLR10_01060, partial [Nitrososphaeraceae archaeon]|nr:hypothetical protein [Nitrososphaeraceae archaeon]
MTIPHLGYETFQEKRDCLMVFEKFFRKINLTEGIFSIDFDDKKLQSENRFFSDIHLYDDLKMLLSRML